MRAKNVNEDSVYSILRPKDPEKIINDFFDFAQVINLTHFVVMQLDKLREMGLITKKTMPLIEQKIKLQYENAWDWTQSELDDFEFEEYVTESLENILKPKSKEEIIKTVKEMGGDEITLKDGRLAWIYEMGGRGMAGEPMSWLEMIDENGVRIPLTDEGLNLLDRVDREKIVKWQDHLGDENQASAISYVM